jgi:hypothetical protein
LTASGTREKLGKSTKLHTPTGRRPNLPRKDHMKTLYAITHIDKDGMRTLTRANQGRNHFETTEEAQHAIDMMIANNPKDSLESIWGPNAVNSLEVRPTLCYDHGDAVAIYFED